MKHAHDEFPDGEIPFEYAKYLYEPGPGRHWFDRATTKAFGSHFSDTAWKGKHGISFVESCHVAWTGPRRYRPVIVTGPGKLHTGSWYPSPVVAKRAAIKFAKEGIPAPKKGEA